MKIRPLVFWVLLIFSALSFAIIFTGCSKEVELSNSSKEITDSKSVDLKISTDKDVNQEITYQEIYYKIELEEVSLDKALILKNLLGDFDETVISSENTSEGTEYSIVKDGVRHTWITEGNTFLYYNDASNNGSITENEAKNQGDDFMEGLDFYINKSPAVNEENGIFTLEYCLQYENTRILGNRVLEMQDAITEHAIGGEYISLTIGGGGINNVYISNIMKPVNVLKEFDPKADFINYDKLQDVLNTYFDKIYSEFGEDISASFVIDKMEVIYMPYTENNSQILVPVIEVEGTEYINGEQSEFSIIVDAVTGYIYSS